MATSVPVERENRSTKRKSGSASLSPTRPPTTRKATATKTIQRTESTETEPSVTRRTTTVRTTRPITSSATAAPRTSRASVVANARRSPKTRAVMPTLVAVSAAPDEELGVEVVGDRPHGEEAEDHRRDDARRWPPGSEARPTLPSSPRSISMPTSSRRRTTPSSPRVTSTSSPWPTRPKTDGPMMTPATISPTTAGMPMRSETSAASLGGDEDDEDVGEELGEVHGLVWRSPGRGVTWTRGAGPEPAPSLRGNC